jgi:hypothetical protein
VSEQPAAASKFTRAATFALPAYLAANFLLRTMTAAHEYPMRTEQVLEMLIDGLAIVGLFGVRKYMPMWLFWIAFIAGLGLFAIRLHSDASWWTGHLMYSLDRR